MKEFQVYNKKIKSKVPDMNTEWDDDVKILSYSQFSKYMQCPKAWELRYVQGIKDDKPSIALVFGEAMHKTIQYILYLVYEKSVKEAMELDTSEMLLTAMMDDYKKRYKKYGDHFWNKAKYATWKDELTDHYLDGLAILEEFLKDRNQYFSKRHIELVGIEIPIYFKLKSGSQKKLMIKCYLDIVIRDKRTDEYIIYDIKTSKRGWGKYDKANKIKISQLPFYKKLFSEQYDIPLDKIKVEFFIVKRKVDTDVEWKIKRIQEFVPSSGSVSINFILSKFYHFVDTSFNADGSYNTDRDYLAMTGRNNFNCTYCPHNENEELCPSNKRKRIT